MQVETMNQAQAVVAVRNVTKRFPGVVANAGVSLDFNAESPRPARRERAGKSTLIGMLAGHAAAGRRRDPDRRRGRQDHLAAAQPRSRHRTVFSMCCWNRASAPPRVPGAAASCRRASSR